MPRALATPILVTGDEGTGTLAAVRGLKAGGYEVWLAVARPDTPAARSRTIAGILHVTDPGEDSEQHVRQLADAARRTGARAILPGTEASLRAVTGREHLFPDGIAVGTSPRDALQRATDKSLLSELARDAGLEAPPNVVLSRHRIAAIGVEFPAVIKPLRTVDDAGRGMRNMEVETVSGPAELRGVLAARADQQPVLLQPYIAGTLGAVCGVAWHGQLVCAVHQRSPRIWPPRVGISSYAITMPPDPERESAIAALVRALEWSGIFGVQFLIRDGHEYVIDFNPRIYGSMGLAIGAGLNLPTIWANLLLQRPTRAGSYRVGVRYRAEEDDYRALLDVFRRGQRVEALQGLIPRRHTVHALFAASDPAPSLTSIEKLRRRLGVRRGEGRLTSALVEAAAVAAARRMQPAVGRVIGFPPIYRLIHRRATRAWRSTDTPLIVCLGNINRSPFAARLAAGKQGKMATSAGFYRVAGRRCPERTIAVAAKYGVDLSSHRSQALDPRQLDGARAVFVFDLMNVVTIACRRFSALRRTHLLGSLSAEGDPFIADPHGQPPEVLDHALDQIVQAVRSAAGSPQREQPSSAAVDLDPPTG